MAKFTGTESEDSDNGRNRRILEKRTKEKTRKLQIEWNNSKKFFRDAVLNKKIIGITFDDKLKLHLDDGSILDIFDCEQWKIEYRITLTRGKHSLTM